MNFRFSKLLLLSGDIILLYVSLFCTVFIRFSHDLNPELWWSHIVMFSFLYPLWLVIFYIFDLYDLSMPPKTTRFPKMFFGALGIAFLVAILYFYVIPTQVITPKTNLVLHLMIFGFFFVFWRLFFFGRIRSRVWWRVGLFSYDAQSTKLEAYIRSHVHMGYQPVFCDVSKDLSDQIAEHQLNMFILPTNLRSNLDQIKTMYGCLGRGMVFLDSTSAFEFFARRIPISSVDHYWFLRNVQDHRNGLIEFVKRGFDVMIALLILCVSLPFWLLILLSIKLDDGGPIFYRQMRVGRDRRLFEILKFRTMRIDTEDGGVQWAQKNDSRVTRVGNFLRASHLDELPQMLNVIRGEISLVGPRPERPEFVDQLEKEIPHYHIRHLVQPGFTGWAQIRFRYARSVTDAQTKFEYDLYYIKNRSFVMDVLILIKTVSLLFKKQE